MAHTVIRLGYVSVSGGGGGGGGIEEYASLAAFPPIGQSTIIYLALDTKKIYKWSSGSYIEISPSEVNSVNGQVGIVSLDAEDIQMVSEVISVEDKLIELDGAIAQEILDRQDGDSDTLDAANAYTDSAIAAIPPVDLSEIYNYNQNTVFVDSVNGVDAVGRGTLIRPFRTINYAYSQVPSLGNPSNTTYNANVEKFVSEKLVIKLAPGTYTENVIIGFKRARVAIVGNGARIVGTVKMSVLKSDFPAASLEALKASFPPPWTGLSAQMCFEMAGDAGGGIEADASGNVILVTGRTSIEFENGGASYNWDTNFGQFYCYMDNVGLLGGMVMIHDNTITSARAPNVVLEIESCNIGNADSGARTYCGYVPFGASTTVPSFGSLTLKTHNSTIASVFGPTITIGEIDGCRIYDFDRTMGGIVTNGSITGSTSSSYVGIVITQFRSLTGAQGASVYKMGRATGTTRMKIDSTSYTTLAFTRSGAGILTPRVLDLGGGVSFDMLDDARSQFVQAETSPVFPANYTPASTDTHSHLKAIDSTIATLVKISEKGAPNGVAPLNASSKIDATYLPSYVDDVLEFANLAAFPPTGETGKIYIALNTNLTYRWSGSTYVQISPSPVVSVNGQTGAVVLTKSDVGLSNVDNTSDLNKPISTATQTALNAKQDSLGFTPENVANKSTDIALGTSDTLYPSQKAVKTYVDSFVATSSPVVSVNGQTGAVVLDSDDINNQQANPNYWDIADNSTIKAHLDELASRREAQNNVTKEPTGFATRAESTTSFSDSGPDRTFTIAPVGASFTFYVKGFKFTKTTSESIQIPNLAGNHFIYYNDAGVLSSTQVASSDLFKDNALLSIVYWNTDTSSHSYFAEERHGLQMDGETHSYLHTVLGAQYLSGLALENFVVNGNGSLATHAQFTADEGTIRDEDLLLTLAAQTQIPVLYRQGTLWRKKAADSFPIIYSGTAGYTGANGRLPYNQLVSGSWQLTEIANNGFVLVHLFGTNDKETPIIAVQGIETYGNVTAARLAASSEITSLAGLPFAEFVALGSVVFESANAYTNTPKAIIRSVNGGSYVDFRGTQLYTPAGVATNHGLLSGLANDDHIQYHTDARGDARYYTKAQVDALVGAGGSPGDINEKSYSFSNSQVVPESITDFLFSNAVVRSFRAMASVKVDATSDLFEVFEISGVQKGSEWDISVSSTGDDTGLNFSITSVGQVQYTSPNYSGFVSGVIKFRALTTSV